MFHSIPVNFYMERGQICATPQTGCKNSSRKVRQKCDFASTFEQVSKRLLIKPDVSFGYLGMLWILQAYENKKK